VISKGIRCGNVVVGSTTHHTDDTIKQRFREYTAGKPVECEHRPLSRGKITHWLAWNTSGLMCPICVTQDHLMIAGTPDDRRCDICGVVQPEGEDTIESCTIGIQTDPKPGQPLIPPILLNYGRCKSCHQSEKP
jgi:hypothetical protein